MMLISCDKNRGKSSSITTSNNAASGDAIIIQDTDLEYDLREYLNLLRPIRERFAYAI